MNIDNKSNLRSIIHQVTGRKLQKLQTQKDTLTTHFLPILNQIQSGAGEPLENLQALRKVMTTCPIKDFVDPEENRQLKDLDILISSAESAPGSETYNQILSFWVGELVRKIRFKLQRCEYSFLYGVVMSEYLDIKRDKSSPESGIGCGDKKGKAETLKELKDHIFDPSTLDKEAFRAFLLQKVFHFEELEARKAFMELQKRMSNFSKHFGVSSVDPDDLKHCLKALYSVNLLGEEKRATLRELEQNPTALKEMATLLTDDIDNIASWRWPNPVPIDFRRNMAGKFRAFMDEDIITALFLQYVGARWSSQFKSVFLSMYNEKTLWKWKSHPHARGNITITKQREQMHTQNFLTVLPTNIEDQYASKYDDDDYDDIPKTLKRKRSSNHTPSEVKQHILHTISNELKLNAVLNPESHLTIVQTDMEWFGPSLSHDAVLVLMEVLGVSDVWVNFFQRFLQAPLLFEGDSEPRLRKRGVAISHLLSTLFGESLLFVMDLYMQKCSGIVLHRIHDDFWFWDADQEQVVKAWKAIEKFTAASGLKINRDKSGSVRVGSGAAEKSVTFGKKPLPQQQVKWGFLDLYSDGVFRINTPKLDPYIEEMTRILTAAPTVVDWVNTYNKYMAFFVRNFGKCALTFGSQHVLQIINALNHVTSEVFKESDGNPLVALQSKFEVLKSTDLLDAWVFWPVQRGGLGLVNPSLGMLSLLKTYQRIENEEDLDFSLLPEEDKAVWKRLIKESEEKRQKPKYKRPKLAIDEEILTDSEFSDDNDENPGDGVEDWDNAAPERKRKRRYLTFDKLCNKFRLYRWWHWGAKYERLLQSPEEEGPKSRGNSDWMAALYGPKLFEHFGARAFINTKLIPVSLISMMKTSRVKY